MLAMNLLVTADTIFTTEADLKAAVKELPNARGPGYAARALTPTPTSTSRTTA